MKLKKNKINNISYKNNKLINTSYTKNKGKKKLKKLKIFLFNFFYYHEYY